jgi:hypothetical protein
MQPAFVVQYLLRFAVLLFAKRLGCPHTLVPDCQVTDSEVTDSPRWVPSQRFTHKGDNALEYTTGLQPG